MTISYRLLGPEDGSQLDRLAPAVFDNPLDPAATTAFLADSRHHLAVAIDDGVVVGMASAVHYLHPDKPAPELWVNEVGVAPTHQGRGIGQGILLALLQRARALGCSEAWVATSRDNHAALGLYRKVGGLASPEAAVLVTFPLSPATAGADDQDIT